MKRRVLRIVLTVAVMAGAVVWLWPREREPVYQGKKLSEWLNEYDTPRPRVFSSSSASLDFQEHRQLVRKALREIGTNALPCLMKWVRSPPPTLKPWLLMRSRRLPTVLRSGVLERYLAPPKRDRATLAGLGFQALGLHASPAIPELVRLSRDGSRPQVAFQAMRCIALIGDEGVDEILRLFDNPNPVIRASATNIVRAFAPWRLSGDTWWPVRTRSGELF